MSQPKSVVLLGKGDLAIRISNWFLEQEQYDLLAVVPSMPEPDWTGSLASFASKKGVPVIGSGRYEDLPQLADHDWHPDMAFSVFYSRILSAEFIARCHRILNLHNSPLPKYRGVSPINWALKNGERSHGVSIHEISPGIDDGPIVGQVSFPIYPEFDEVRDVYLRALAFGWELFRHVMPLFDSIEPRAQDPSLATIYYRKDDERLGDRRRFTRAESVSAE